MSPRTFLIHGLIAGIAAGFLAFGAAFFFGEPHLDRAIAVEKAAAAHHHEHEEELFSRRQQSTLGLATGTVVIGTALGGVAGLAAAFAMGRLGRLRPAASTAVVTAVGFVAFALAVWAKYPPDPPGVGSASTIGSRTASYFAFQGICVVAAVAAVALAARLARALDGWTAAVLPALGWLALVTVAGLLLPAAQTIPDGFPAGALWGFRLASIATQAVLWGTITVVLSGLVHRAARADEARRALAASVRS